MATSSTTLASANLVIPTVPHASIARSVLAALLDGLSRRDRLKACAEPVLAHALPARTTPDIAPLVLQASLNSDGNAETTLELPSR